MSIRWSRSVAPVKDSVVEFREGALPVDAQENQLYFRLDDMSRRVEEIQKRNADLEAKLAAQNETIRDHTLEKLAHLEGRLALRDDATKNETLQKLTSLETCIGQKGAPLPPSDDVLRHIKTLEARIDTAIQTAPLKTRTMETLDRLEQHTPLLSSEVPDQWMAERARLYQLKSAHAKAR